MASSISVPYFRRGGAGSRPETAGAQRAGSDVEVLAQLMDNAFRIPGLGMRFGLDSIIGLVPGVGDALTSLVSLYILAAAHRYAVPAATQMRMALNIVIDGLLGAVPLVGDAFDVYWKVNVRNVELLRRHLAAGPEAAGRLKRRDRAFVVVLIAFTCLVLVGCVAAAIAAVAWMATAIGELSH
jgi:hypothetical protein